MKKLSLLVAILLIATIGGVYATWNYSQGDVVSKSSYFDEVTKITDKVVENAKGVIEITHNDLTITIDDSDNDHFAEWNLTGSITIKFTPNAGADSTVKEHGIDLQWNLVTTNTGTGSTTWVYGDPATKIFCVNTEVVTLTKESADDVAVPGSFVWTVSAEELISRITFYSNVVDTNINNINSAGANSNLYLDTVAKYDAFKLALHSGTIGIVVAENNV